MTRRAYVVLAAAAALLAAGLITASLVGARTGEPAPKNKVPARAAPALLRDIPQQGPALGRPDAPVTLVEFADVQCPYCADWSNAAFEELVRDYVRPGKVRIVFSGIAFIGPGSEKGLRFAHAAGRQGKLWEAVHLLYANQGPENSGWVSDDFLRDLGARIPGLDVDRALRESYSAEVDDRIAAARAEATRLGVRGTPSFAVGRADAAVELVPVSSLDAGALRPALDSILAR